MEFRTYRLLSVVGLGVGSAVYLAIVWTIPDAFGIGVLFLVAWLPLVALLMVWRFSAMQDRLGEYGGRIPMPGSF